MNNANPQTRATEKYQKKVGLMSKSYKLKREVVEAFAEACDKIGVSQAGKLTELMKGIHCGSERKRGVRGVRRENDAGSEGFSARKSDSGSRKSRLTLPSFIAGVC